MRHLGQIAHDGLTLAILAKGNRQGTLGMGKLLRPYDFLEENHIPLFVGDFDANDAFARDRRQNADGRNLERHH